MGDLETLKDMGFDPERASLALKAGGNLPSAIDWLDKHADTPLADLQASAAEASAADPQVEATKLSDGLVAQSWICNECGKKFRSMTEVQFHANKSGHEDMAESTEALAPLTAEERAAKLDALKSKLAEKRAAQADADKEERKKNEAIKRLATRETQDIKEALEAKERIKDAERKRREKREDAAAKQRILDRIAADKADRRAKAEAEKAARQGTAVPAAAVAPVAAPATAATTTSKPAAAYTETRLRLQTPTGNVMKSFGVDVTLYEVASALEAEQQGLAVSSFSTNFPKKTYERTEFGMTLKEAGMVPSAAVIVR